MNSYGSQSEWFFFYVEENSENRKRFFVFQNFTREQTQPKLAVLYLSIIFYQSSGAHSVRVPRTMTRNHTAAEPDACDRLPEHPQGGEGPRDAWEDAHA